MELKFMNFKDYKLKAVNETFEPVIDGFLNRKEFMLIHATAKTGKSMFALNIALAIATGSDFLGMDTIKSKVLYLQTEISSTGLSDRIDSMLRGMPENLYEYAQENLLIADTRIRIDIPQQLEALKKQVETELPSLLIIDPFYDLHNKNEDNAAEMAPLLSNIREIARSVGCAVILIHHQGKKGEGQSSNAGHACRGSSAFADVPDSSVSLSKDKGGYSMRGIFRNRASLEEFRLQFDEKSFLFSPGSEMPKKVKTRDLIINEIKKSQDGLTKKELVDLLGSKQGIQASAVQKQIETLRAEGLLSLKGEFKSTRFFVTEFQGGNSSP
jgi:hypothetical protein